MAELPDAGRWVVDRLAESGDVTSSGGPVISCVPAVGGAGATTLAAILATVRLTPAEAMRPEAPAVYRRTLTERLGAGQLLDAAARMVVRNLERRPLRSLMSIAGMGMACGILVMSNLQRDAIEEMIAVQFGLAQRDDDIAALATCIDLERTGAADRIAHGAWRVEPPGQFGELGIIADQHPDRAGEGHRQHAGCQGRGADVDHVVAEQDRPDHGSGFEHFE